MNTHTMIRVDLCDLPDVFRDTPYYQMAVELGDTSTVCPSTCAYFRSTISSTTDLAHMLRTILFWGFQQTPWSVYEFVSNPPVDDPVNIQRLCAAVPDLDKSNVHRELLTLNNNYVDEAEVVCHGLPMLQFYVSTGRINLRSKFGRYFAVKAAKGSPHSDECVRWLESNQCRLSATPWETAANSGPKMKHEKTKRRRGKPRLPRGSGWRSDNNGGWIPTSTWVI